MVNHEIVQSVSQRLSSSSNDGEGGECKYFKINETQGLKLVTPFCAEKRHKRYLKILEAHENLLKLCPDIAPKIYQKNIQIGLYLGYIVEHALTLEKFPEKTLQEKLEIDPGEWCWTESKKYRELKEKLDKIGYKWSDTCNFNAGFIGERLVIVDFGAVYIKEEI